MKIVASMRRLKHKLLLFILPLCLVPLVGISVFSYFVAKDRITEDRIVLYLQQIASEIADVIQLTLLEKKEETVSMTLTREFRDFLTVRDEESPTLLLDKFTLVHQVYDLIALFDVDGRLVALNSIDRNSRMEVIEYLDEEARQDLIGQNLVDYIPDAHWLQQVRSRRFGYIGWHMSPLVQRLYRYQDNDIAKQYSIGFAAPIVDDKGVVVGGILSLMNWEFVQEILDRIEEDLAERQLGSGYAFLFGDDLNTVIGHKYRKNRKYVSPAPEDFLEINNYGTRLIEDHHLVGLQKAVVDGASSFQYEYPPGVSKISGLSHLNHEHFRWVCGVGINNEDIFAPVQELKMILISAASFSIILVLFLTYSVARRITVPLNELTVGAKIISDGDFTQRVHVIGRDEIGDLAKSFNEMARSVEERSQALIDLNRSLEEKVKERTSELEKANLEMESAYHELKEAQFQLVQSEKLASLGQLVAGIAHEIKNPLNFIYGNTGFLREYVEKLNRLMELAEERGRFSVEDRASIERFKQEINYDFMLEDLGNLIQNFEEGAKRIHSIIGDLRTFSRMDSDEFKEVDVHEPIDLALSLLQNEYRGRIEITREYGDLPKIESHAGRLNQVFMNLLLNACQAIDGPGKIEIKTFLQGGLACISIKDSGSGIAKEDLARIFEPFYTTKPVGKGTGLGLSISYAIIQQHNGVINVESELGKGTVFMIRLPVKQ